MWSKNGSFTVNFFCLFVFASAITDVYTCICYGFACASLSTCFFSGLFTIRECRTYVFRSQIKLFTAHWYVDLFGYVRAATYLNHNEYRANVERNTWYEKYDHSLQLWHENTILPQTCKATRDFTTFILSIFHVSTSTCKF